MLSSLAGKFSILTYSPEADEPISWDWSWNKKSATQLWWRGWQHHLKAKLRSYSFEAIRKTRNAHHCWPDWNPNVHRNAAQAQNGGHPFMETTLLDVNLAW